MHFLEDIQYPNYSICQGIDFKEVNSLKGEFNIAKVLNSSNEKGINNMVKLFKWAFEE